MNVKDHKVMNERIEECKGSWNKEWEIDECKGSWSNEWKNW